MEREFSGGIWPVMLTPFLKTGEIDYEGVEKIVDWYVEQGCSGLFAVCQSSEMFYLSLEERVALARAVVKFAKGRIPVVASGHISDREEDQINEINQMSETGVDAVILLTNRFASAEESDAIWRERCSRFLKQIDPQIPLGFYECPYPYKRLMSLENLDWCVQTGRFYFLKDTCCDLNKIEKRLEILKGTKLKLYNANSATLLESLKKGAWGFCGVMANFHPELYVYLYKNREEKEINFLQDFLSIAALIERQYYPVNAKYNLQKCEGLKIETYSRKQDDKKFTQTWKQEVQMLHELSEVMGMYYKKHKI